MSTLPSLIAPAGSTSKTSPRMIFAATSGILLHRFPEPADRPVALRQGLSLSPRLPVCRFVNRHMTAETQNDKVLQVVVVMVIVRVMNPKILDGAAAVALLLFDHLAIGPPGLAALPQVVLLAADFTHPLLDKFGGLRLSFPEVGGFLPLGKGEFLGRRRVASGLPNPAEQTDNGYWTAPKHC